MSENIKPDDPHMARGRGAAQAIVTAFVAGDHDTAQATVKDLYGTATAEDMAALGAATRFILDVLAVLISVLEDECKIDVMAHLRGVLEFEADGSV